VREMRRTRSNGKREASRRPEVSVQDVQPPLERGDENKDRQAPRLNVGDTMTIAGVTYRILSQATGPYVRSDGKGQIEGIGFIRVEPV
jgi:hypothetical protein